MLNNLKIKRHLWYEDFYLNNQTIDLSKNICYDRYLLPKLNCEISSDALRQYPDTAAVYRSLAAHYKVDVKNLAIGYGAGDIIYRLIQLFQHLSLAIHGPTFQMAGVWAENLGMTVNYSSEISDLKGDVLYLANPNGITGTVISRDDINDLLDKFKWIILDEAYADFSIVDCSVFDQASRLANVIVVKTLSKAIACPGLRFGFCAANELVIEQLQAYRSASVTTGLTDILLDSLLENIPFHVCRMLETRDYIQNKYPCVDSQGSYVLFKNDPKFNCRIKVTEQNLYRMSLTDLETFKSLENGQFN